MPDDVQDQGSQGGEATDGGIFAPYLEAVPDEARESVASYLKDAEKNVNERIAKASEIEKTLGPYQQVEGLSNYQPDQLQELLGWHQQIVSSPEAYQQWLAQEAEQAGFTKAEAEELQEAEAMGELTPEAVQKIIDERVQQALGPITEQQQEFARAQAINDIEQDIHSQLGRIESENKIKLSDAAKETLLKLGEGHEGDDWVQVGFDRLKERWAEGQKSFVSDKSSQPQVPMSTGGTEAAKPPTTFDEANKQFKERLRQQQQS